MGYSKHELPTRKRNDYKEKTLTIMYKMLVLTLQNDTITDESCPYCKKFHHTLKQCWLKNQMKTWKTRLTHWYRVWRGFPSRSVFLWSDCELVFLLSFPQARYSFGVMVSSFFFVFLRNLLLLLAVWEVLKTSTDFKQRNICIDNTDSQLFLCEP